MKKLVKANTGRKDSVKLMLAVVLAVVHVPEVQTRLLKQYPIVLQEHRDLIISNCVIKVCH